MSFSGFCSPTYTTEETQADLAFFQKKNAPLPPTHSSKNSVAFYQDDDSLDAFIQDIEHKTARYGGDEFIDYVLNTEQRQIDRQNAFNNTLVYDIELPLSRIDRPLHLGIYYKDIIKAVFTSASVGLDWYLYQALETHYVNVLSTSLIKQQSLPTANSADALHVSYSTFKRPELAKLIGTHFLVHQLAQALRNSLMGSKDQAFSFFKTNEPAQNPIPIFSLIEEHIVMFMPFNSTQTNLIEIANSLFKRCGLIPAFFQSTTFEMTQSLAFQMLFIAWFNNMVLVPVWENYAQQNHETLNNFLSTYHQLPATAKEKRAVIEKNIASCIHTGIHFSFRTWFAMHNKKMAEWHFYSSVITSLPGWYTMIKQAYNIYQQAVTDTETADK
ncbi:hypothetical protein IPF37_04795 [bacterium]|nr:MAG: hypothetical protein IPF37_04795 [bacterium]